MRRKLTPSQIAEKIKAKHGDLVTLVEESYIGLRIRCKFIDKDFGEWITDPWVVLCGGRHPKRGRASMGEKQSYTREEVQLQINKVHGATLVLGDDFKHKHIACTVTDVEYGSWQARPDRIIIGTSHPQRRAAKARNTCMQRYGVSHTNFVPGVMEKISAKRPKWTREKHWKTGQTLVSMSSYEKAFIEWCAKHCIDFDWQIKHEMPDGKFYVIDAYIKDGEFANTWIEIKGWMRESGRKKWEWFHSHNPDCSQLWTKDVLKKLQVLL